MSTTPRIGFETFTGAFMPVVYDETRAARKLPPWISSVDGQAFMDSEVEETHEITPSPDCGAQIRRG